MTQTKEVQCIGVIVDGNRRWARERNLHTLKGHEAGYTKLKEMADWAQEVGIKYVIAYVFSLENMKRSKEEVSYLMDLTLRVFTEDVETFKKKNSRIHIVGDLSFASEKIQKAAQDAQERTKECDGIHLVLAYYYGGRQEIVSAVNTLLQSEKKEVTEEDFSKALWTCEIPNPDLIIRTSGEMRLSNFLLWQAAYSELFFPKFHFPDFTKEAFFDILKEFKQRQRRFGQ